MARVRELFQAGSSVYGSSLRPYGLLIYSVTPLYAAAAECRAEIVSELLSAGAPPELVRLLLCATCPVSPPPQGRSLGPFALLSHETPLNIALEAGCAEVVIGLLRAGANPERGEVLGMGAFASGTPGGMAAGSSYDDASMLAELLKAGGNPNEGFSVLLGWAADSPLSIAAARGNARVVSHLLQAGAAPDLGQSFHYGSRVASPLSLAAKNGHAGICRALLAAGASLEAAGGEALVSLVRKRGLQVEEGGRRRSYEEVELLLRAARVSEDGDDADVGLD